MITWDETFSTGVPDIDAQHKKLIEKYNEFLAAMEAGKGRAAATEILDFLQFYADWHFKKEEDCMEQYRCPVAKANKQAHATFIARFGAFYEEWQTGSMSWNLMQDTYLELGDWIENHILRVDTQLASCVPGDE